MTIRSNEVEATLKSFFRKLDQVGVLPDVTVNVDPTRNTAETLALGLLVVDVSAPARLDGGCPFCMSPEPLVWVHGHGQCASCKTSVSPCCDGQVGDCSS
jgi:hypothetical protein